MILILPRPLPLSKLGHSTIPPPTTPPITPTGREPAEPTLHVYIMSEFKLAAARYGKDAVRVFRLIKPSNPGGQHQVVEYNVCLLLEGDIETRCASFL